MSTVYKLVNGEIEVIERDRTASKDSKDADQVVHKWSFADFMEHESALDDIVEASIENAYDKIEKAVKIALAEDYKKIFQKNANVLSERQLVKEEKGLLKKYKDFLIAKMSKIGGINMFKTLKEAKQFTAHLDAIANDVEKLEGLDDGMRTHLAEKLDKLSDLIEEESFATEKQANGVGSGAWAYDADEARYMSTFGGTGALKQDADEAYMAQFAGDDHKEVLNRKEPADIKGAGPKAPQHSDSLAAQEPAIAQSLKGVVKAYLASKK